MRTGRRFLVAALAASALASCFAEDSPPETSAPTPQQAAYIAVCLPNRKSYVPALAKFRVVVVASYSPAAGLTLLLSPENADDNDIDLERIASTLSGLRWNALSPLGKKAPPPAMTKFDEVQVVAAGEAEEGERVDEEKIVLGPCDAPGTLYSTEKISAVRSTPLRVDRMDDRKEALLHKIDVDALAYRGASKPPEIISVAGQSVSPGYAVEDMTIKMKPVGGDVTCTLWGLFVKRQEAPALTAGNFRRYDNFSSVKKVAWGRLGEDEGALIAVVYYQLTQDIGGSGDRVRVVAVGEKNQIKTAVGVIDSEDDE